MQNMCFENTDVTDISQLTERRIAYLEEDNGGLSEADLTLFRDSLPDYFRRNLNKSIFAYVARKEKILAACAFLFLFLHIIWLDYMQ